MTNLLTPIGLFVSLQSGGSDMKPTLQDLREYEEMMKYQEMIEEYQSQLDAEERDRAVSDQWMKEGSR